MKTLCFSLGLLLFVVCCTDAMPVGVSVSTDHGQCCFEFREKQLPPKRVTGIIRTHPRCQQKAFIVSTVRKEFCFRDNFQWAVDTFNGFNPEGSG
uniref:Chemokine interleukin-8-like domain-containing protein n=1 Tax=Oryzias sinensis TaxID=183150 RepID=A0A8C7ZM74_9TELE